MGRTTQSSVGGTKAYRALSAHMSVRSESLGQLVPFDNGWGAVSVNRRDPTRTRNPYLTGTELPALRVRAFVPMSARRRTRSSRRPPTRRCRG
jgi:hypothetical protein